MRIRTDHLALLLCVCHNLPSHAYHRNTAIPPSRALLRIRLARTTHSPNQCRPPTYHRLESLKDFDSWNGDDIRWTRKLRRRLWARWNEPTETPVRDGLVIVNVVAFLGQAVNTLQYLIATFPSYWATQRWSMVSDAVIDSSATTGPLMRDFIFSAALGSRQPHRYLSSGLLHGGMLHLILNMYSLRQVPNWIETGLGWNLFLTTYMVGIIAGNYFHARSAMDQFLGCLGSSGGIVALYGLAFVALVKMDNRKASLQILKSMASLFLFGAIIPSLSNASHIGGFISGCVMGILFSPGYRKSYSLRRKNSVDVDVAPRDFRLVMGFGVVPNEKPPLPLWILWAGAILYAATEPKLQSMPMMVVQGLVRPGSLTGTSL